MIKTCRIIELKLSFLTHKLYLISYTNLNLFRKNPINKSVTRNVDEFIECSDYTVVTVQ